VLASPSPTTRREREADDVAERGDPPPPLVERVRQICTALPEVVEERAWVGLRWVVRTKTFASLLQVEQGWPPAYARQAGTGGPATVLTFRADPDEREVLEHAGPPWFTAPWGTDVTGLVLATDPDDQDWHEVGELLTDSWRLWAPARLAEQLDQP
jgi:hypothetical protein